MEKPIIGLTPLYETQEQCLWMRDNYMAAVFAAGGLPVILPLTESEEDVRRLAMGCSGFIFTGGPDVHPALFGEETQRFCGAISPRRDTFELLLAKHTGRKAVLGICRGVQLLNVAHGGTLYQDLPAEAAGTLCHDQKPPYSTPVHSVRVACESPLFAICGKETMLVDSMHHQGVKGVATSLRTAATAPDGLVECLYKPEEEFYIGVQWHPEYMYAQSECAQKLLAAFVLAARKG